MNTVIFDYQSKIAKRENVVGAATRLSDEKLLQLCQQYGKQAREWRQKFIGLLPEVNRRRLYEKKGFASIFEFASRLCGLSAEQVRLALNLEKRFEDKPVLQKMLVNGEVSINKLARVVSIATSENEEELAAKIKVLPKSALDTLVRDEKFANGRVGAGCGGGKVSTQVSGAVVDNENGLQNLFFEAKGLPGQTLDELGNVRKLNFQLTNELVEELNELDAKGFDVNELLRKMLERRREEIAQRKKQIAEDLPGAASRYIPVRVKKILQEEFGEKCAIRNCKKLSEQTHHTKRFALSQDHDPRFMARFCRDHHILAHSVDLKYHRALGGVMES